MSEFSRDELDVLASARRSLGPSAQDTARVLHKARLAVGSGATPAADMLTATSTARVALMKKVLGWLAIAGTSAWLGYYAGFAAGELHAAQVSRAPRAAPPAAPPAPKPLVHPPPSIAAATPSAPSPSARANAAPRRKPAVLAPLPSESLTFEVPDAPQPSASLDAEIKALRYVERALRNREPKNALLRLAQLDRDVPEGQMREERAAARAMARCEERALAGTLDRAEVMQRVLEFSQQYPASVYFARVRQTCLATIDRDAATD